MARVVAQCGHLVPCLEVAEFVERGAELGGEVAKGQEIDEIKDVFSVDQRNGFVVDLPAGQQDIHRLARRKPQVMPTPAGRLCVVEFVRAAERAPPRLDARLGGFDAALWPAELRAFFCARDVEVDEVLREDKAEDLETDFAREVEEWAILGGNLSLINWVRFSELDFLRRAAFL